MKENIKLNQEVSFDIEVDNRYPTTIQGKVQEVNKDSFKINNTYYFFRRISNLTIKG